MEDKSDFLDEMGYSFTLKLIKIISQDFELYNKIYHILEPEYFENRGIRYIYNKLYEYFEKYGELPSSDAITSIVCLESDEVRQSDARIVLKDVEEISLNGSEYSSIYEGAVRFCKRKRMERALSTCLTDYLYQDKYDNIFNEVESAILDISPNDIGFKSWTDLNLALDTVRPNIVPTGFDTLDKVLKGGVAAGELCMLAGPYGSGKSHWLVGLGCNALRKKKNVLHYSLELSQTSVAVRYVSNLTQIDASEIKENPLSKQKALDIVNQIQAVGEIGRYVIQRFPAFETSIVDLKMHYSKLKFSQFKPDVILIDYLDLMKPTKKANGKYEDLGIITHALRDWSDEIGIPVHSVTQTDRISIDQKVVTGSNMADSINKNRGADILIMISNENKLFLDKNREGVDKLLFDFKLDKSTSTFDIGNGESDAIEKYKNGEVENRTAKSKKVQGDLLMKAFSEI